MKPARNGFPAADLPRKRPDCLNQITYTLKYTEGLRMMEKFKQNLGPALIILAGCFWGSMGIFVRRL